MTATNELPAYLDDLFQPPPERGKERFWIDLMACVQDFERELITGALSMAGGNRKEAARLLCINRTTLLAKMRILKITTPAQATAVPIRPPWSDRMSAYARALRHRADLFESLAVKMEMYCDVKPTTIAEQARQTVQAARPPAGATGD